MRRGLMLVGCLASIIAAGCEEAYVWELPPGFPTPRVPDDNPMSEEKAELGRYLFYDTRLSGNGTQSCGSCHQQALAFTDGLPHGIGSTGEVHPRSAMGLTNIAYTARLTWANSFLDTLEEQALLPMFGEGPVELGLAGREDEMLARLKDDERYTEMFALAFPGDSAPISVENVVRAIASFQRTLISGQSAYDRYTYQNDDSAMSASALRGRDMFNSERFECFHCHGGFNFADSVQTDRRLIAAEAAFHNSALYNIDGRGAYPEPNRGLFEQTREARDMGRFRAPTLRNIEVTAPYMHDGSIATLDEVLDHYEAGGRTILEGPNAGEGSDSPLKDIFMIGFTLTAEEREDMLAFLRSLTDEAFLTDPRFSDPFAAPP